MKYILSIFLTAVTFISFAQNNDKKMMSKNGFTPEQKAIIQTKKLALSLDLSKSQQDKILELNKAQAIATKNKREAHKAMMNRDKKMTSDERFIQMNKMLDSQLVYQSKMKGILNSNQYEQWKKDRKNSKSSMHKKRSTMTSKKMHQKGKMKNKN